MMLFTVRRRWIPILAVSLTLLGCGGSSEEASNQVVFWQFWPKATIQPLVEKFEAENPDIDVVVELLTWQSGQEKITAAVASGRVPDLVELGSTMFPAFAHAEVLVNWSDSTSSMREHYRLWEMCTLEEEVYGLPWLAGTRALYYNRSLFAAAGLDSTRGPETWDELLAACKAVDMLGEDISGYGANAGERYILFKKFMPYAWSNGATILSEDGTEVTFDSPQTRQAMRFYRLLANSGRYDQQSVIDQAFKEGKIGCTLSGSWLLSAIPKEAPKLNFGVALVPRPPGGEHRSFAGGEILASFEKSKNKSGAWRLAQFLCRPENALVIAREKKSVQPTAIVSDDEQYFVDHPKEKIFLDQLAASVSTPTHPNWLRMEAIIEDAVEEVLYGSVSADQAVSRASKELETILKSSNNGR